MCFVRHWDINDAEEAFLRARMQQALETTHSKILWRRDWQHKKSFAKKWWFSCFPCCGSFRPARGKSYRVEDLGEDESGAKTFQLVPEPLESVLR